MQSYIFIIGFILFLFILYGQYRSQCIQCQNNIENFQNRIKNNKTENFHNVIANLLDNKSLSDKIALEIQIEDMEALLQYNKDQTELNKESLLTPYQAKLVENFIYYRDFYFIHKNQNDIVTLVRKNVGEDIVKNMTENEKILGLNLLRRNLFFFYTHYFQKQFIKDKIMWMQTNLGLQKVNQFVVQLRDIYSAQLWFGIKFIEDTRRLPLKIVVYQPEENKFYYKITSSKWLSYQVKKTNATLNETADVNEVTKINEVVDSDKYRKIYKHLQLWYDTNTLQTYAIEWDDITSKANDIENNINNIKSSFYENFNVINSVTIPSGGYMFFDFPNNQNVDALSKELVKISAKDISVLGKDIDVQNIGFWLRNLKLTNGQKQIFIKNILTSYYHANFSTFVDLLSIMAFYDVKNVSSIIDLFSRTDLLYFNNYWTYQDWKLIQRNSLKMGQCNVSGEFIIKKVGTNWRFTYNGTDYYNYWSVIEAYINDLINSITFGLKTNNTSIIASVAEFCYINNPSFIDYILEGSKCEEDACTDVDIERLFEPDRCQNLKDKYRLLYNKITNKECTDLKQFGISKPVVKDIMMFNIMRLALKVRQCQIDFELPEKKCIDNEIEWKIDTSDQPDDKDLSIIKDDSKERSIISKNQNTLDEISSQYDKQLSEYHKLIAQQEKIQLNKLNQFVNSQQNLTSDTIDNMTLQQFGHYIGGGVLNMLNDITKKDTGKSLHAYNSENQIKKENTNKINNPGLINPNDPFLTNYLESINNNITDQTISKTKNISQNSSTTMEEFFQFPNQTNKIMEHFIDSNDENKYRKVENIQGTDVQGSKLWEANNEKGLQSTIDTETKKKKKIRLINEETRNTSNKEIIDEEIKKTKEYYEDVDNQEFNRLRKISKKNKTSTVSGIYDKFDSLVYYVRNILTALSDKDRMMFSGVLMIFIAFSLFFIDISS
jgi:hypothetical protein